VTERARDWQTLVSVALLAVVAHAAALAGEFVYDDFHSIVGNPALRDLASVPRFFADPTAFSGSGASMYRPVLLVTLALNHAMGAGTVIAFKATNVLLHAMTAAVLFAQLRAWAAPCAAAGLAAALFAVHPLASETVNLVCARSEGLLVLALLLGMRCHLAQIRGRRLAWLGTAAATVVACGSKETGVMLLALLVVQEWLSRPAGTWTRAAVLRAGLRVLPVVLLVAAYLLARKQLLGMASVDLVGRVAGDPRSGGSRDLVTQLATMGLLLPRALLLSVWPAGLSIHPPVYFRHGFAHADVLAGWAAVLLLSWCGLRCGRARPLPCLGTAFAWAVALPWVLVPLNVPLAEHRLYGPLAGLALVLASALLRLPSCRGSSLRATPRLATVAGGLLLLGAAASLWRCLAYRDERLLWRPVVAAAPADYHGHEGLALAEYRNGNRETAERLLFAAHCLNPRDRSLLRSWVETLLELGPERASPFRTLAAADALKELAPDDPYDRILRANALLAVATGGGVPSAFAEAEAEALSCLEIAPPKALVYRMAAKVRSAQGDHEGALAHLDASIARGLDFGQVRAERSAALRALGRRREADAELRRARAMAPDDALVQAAWMRAHALPPR
jgi:tetratricopeptide (TPR) repeat protein